MFQYIKALHIVKLMMTQDFLCYSIYHISYISYIIYLSACYCKRATIYFIYIQLNNVTNYIIRKFYKYSIIEMWFFSQIFCRSSSWSSISSIQKIIEMNNKQIKPRVKPILSSSQSIQNAKKRSQISCSIGIRVKPGCHHWGFSGTLHFVTF